ncbi:MAG: sodium:proton antiporter, partial [Casimicrobiaceae bacterium]
MTNTAILAASALLLFAYALEHFGRHFKLPSVVLLIVAGLIARQILDSLGLQYRWVDPIVPLIGTIGLILIVLEGALDLQVRRERRGLIITALASSLLGFLLTLAAFAFLFRYVVGLDTAPAMLAAIPFAVISSAVAIPSASGLPEKPREFIVYESSLSDILGVLVFYAWLGAAGSLDDFALDLFGGGAISAVVAVIAALTLWYFINQIDGHVRFLPLLAGLICLYAVGKELHLSPLIIVLVCGLFINNPHLITWHPRLRSLHTPGYTQTLHEFKGLVAELTFASKSFFFLLLGYWTNVQQMMSIEAWLIAVAGIAAILASRFLILTLLRQSAVAQLVWIAPRGSRCSSGRPRRT